MAHLLAPEVEIELDEIWYFIARESGNLEIADRLVNFITDRFLLIARHPHVGRHRDDLRPGLRSFPVGQYLIFYRVVDVDVVILHVAHDGVIWKCYSANSCENNRNAEQFAKRLEYQYFVLKRVASAARSFYAPNV